MTEMQLDSFGSLSFQICSEVGDLPTVEHQWKGHLNNRVSCTSSGATAGVQYSPSVSTSLPDIL
jgi:hypothetical protein